MCDMYDGGREELEGNVTVTFDARGSAIYIGLYGGRT